MRKFIGFYDNGQFKVGCNGATVYIYDSDNREIDRVTNLPYTYHAAFMPDRNVVALKSGDGYLGFYDLEKREIIRKERVSKIGAQDEGFCFTADGAFFYNIEKPDDTCHTQLAVYETNTFSRVKTLFSGEEKMMLENFEIDKESGKCYVLGYMRNAEGVIDHGFIGVLDIEGEMIAHQRRIVPHEIASGVIADHEYIAAYKKWEAQGFTEKSLEWSWFRFEKIEKPAPVSLKQIYALCE